MSLQPPTSGGSVDDALRTTRVLAVGIASAVPMYMVIAFVVAPTLTAPLLGARTLWILALVLGAVSLTTLGIGQVFLRRLVEGARRRPTPEERLGAYRSAVTIGLAFTESVAIFGLVLSLLSGEPRWAIGFGAVALVAMTLSWPQRATMEALAADVPPIG